MPALADAPILDFESDLHTEARLVLDRTPVPQNATEVAVVLETEGYTAGDAQRLGSPDLFDLAARVQPMLDLYLTPQPPEPSAVPDTVGPGAAPRRISARLLARCLVYSLPWLAGLIALGAGRVSFFSTIVPRQFATTLSLALFLALVLTGPVIQAFSRRGTFYGLQGNRPLLRWATRWGLGGGLLAVVGVVVACYLVLAYGLRAYTPAADRTFLWFGISISVLLLVLTPLYMTRRFAAIGLAVGLGGVFLIVAGRVITHGDYLNPYTALHVALLGIWLTVVPAGVAAVRALRRIPSAEGDIPQQPVRPPRLDAVGRSVAGYAAYGGFFFSLAVVDHLVAGGLPRGAYAYNGSYELAIGAGLLMLIPTLTYSAAATEVFPSAVLDGLARHRVDQTAALCRRMTRYHLRHLAVLVAVGLLAGALLFGGGMLLGPYLTLTSGLQTVRWTFAGALLAYLLFAIGAFSSTLVLTLARPGAAVVAVAGGTALSALVGGSTLAAGALGPMPAALTGLLAGTACFAAVATVRARQLVARFDTSYYQAF
jgi:hypothetical protein